MNAMEYKNYGNVVYDYLVPIGGMIKSFIIANSVSKREKRSALNGIEKYNQEYEEFLQDVIAKDFREREICRTLYIAGAVVSNAVSTSGLIKLIELMH